MKKPIQTALPVPGFRKGLLGDVPVGADYMRNVNKRAARMQAACKINRPTKQKENDR